MLRAACAVAPAPMTKKLARCGLLPTGTVLVGTGSGVDVYYTFKELERLTAVFFSLPGFILAELLVAVPRSMLFQFFNPRFTVSIMFSGRSLQYEIEVMIP